MRTGKLIGALMALALAVAGGVLLSAPSVTLAQSANTACTGTLPAGSYANVTVPPNQSCELDTGVTVSGTVTVQPNATLNLIGATVGNLVAQQGTVIRFLCGTVTGNVTDTNGSLFDQANGCPPSQPTVKGNEAISGTGDIQLAGSMISGSVTVTDNHAGGPVTVTKDRVGNNLTVDNNTGSEGIHVTRNIVTNNLVCTGNTPPPTAFGNSARQNVGQCVNAPP